jgi:hypothetical protein
MSLRFDWSKMGRTRPTALVEARNLAHHALQWATRAARANLQPVPDDSHSALTWDAEHAALLSHPLPAKGGDVRAGLRIARLELIVTRGANVLDAFQYEGKTDAAAGAWVESKLKSLGLKSAGMARPPYAMAEHPLAAGRPHELAMLGRELGELSRWFGGGAEVLESFRSGLGQMNPGPGPVLCWPHHFDIATLVALESGHPANARSVGVGLSPGDEYYAQPYVYVSPWPRIDPAGLPEAPAPGRWHTQDFIGAVAVGEEILGLKDRAGGILGFMNAAFEISRARLTV